MCTVSINIDENELLRGYNPALSGTAAKGTEDYGQGKSYKNFQ